MRDVQKRTRSRFAGYIKVTLLEACTVKRIQRQTIAAAGLIAAAIVSAPIAATAQRNGPRTPIFIAVTFRSPTEPKLGIDVAEGLRQRMIKLFPQGPRAQLRVVTREQINAQLTAAGYPADSAITTTDLRDLGKNVGADETLEGTATRTAEGVRVTAHFYSLNNVGAAEVLPTVVDKDPGNAGRQMADNYTKARKELPDYEQCRGALINREVDRSIVAARAALVQYDKGVLPRACLMTAYNQQYKDKKLPIDSVLRVGEEIMKIDADNEVAMGLLADAYMAKGDTAKAIDMNVRLYRLNPTNVTQAQGIIQFLAGIGAPDKALPIVKDLLNTNPGDAQILETDWKLLQATKQWKQAIATGEEMVKFDSSRADTTYFTRQIGAAYSDSQPQLVLQFLGKATAKFPKNTHYWLGYSQELRKQGQLQQSLDAAKKALAIDPTLDNGYLAVLSLYVALGQTDSALAFGKVALKSGANKDVIGNALLTLISPAMNKAQAADKAGAPEARADWEAVYHMSAVVDSLVPQVPTAFFMSFSAFNIASGILPTLAGTAKTDKPKACAETKYASDMITVVDLNMSRGGRYNPQAAAQILTAVSTQVKPYLETLKKQLACK
jgi:tetratricopeptide (TPR) repeat protein